MTTPVTRCAHHGHTDCCTCGPARAARKPSRRWRDIAWSAVVIAVVAAPYAAWLSGG